MGWRQTATPSVTTFGRGADRSDPKTSDWSPVRGDVFRACDARSWRRWRASAPSTTCGWSRAATRIRPLRSSTRLRGRCSWTSRRPSICISWPVRRAAAGITRDVEDAADGARELIDQFAMPAIVASRCLDVLAANSVARALSPGFAPGQNFLRWRLLDPAARDLYVDWDEATDVAVSGLREVAGERANDPRLRPLIDELSAASARFRELWARADVGYRPGVIHMRHPVVGDLYLHRNRFNIPHSGGQHLMIYRAEPGSPSAEALEELRRGRFSTR